MVGRGWGWFGSSAVALLMGGRWNCGAGKLLHCFTAWRVGSISKGYPYTQPSRPTAKLPVPIGGTAYPYRISGVNDNRYCLNSMNYLYAVMFCLRVCYAITTQWHGALSSTQYDGYTMRRLHNTTATQCDGYTMRRLHIFVVCRCQVLFYKFLPFYF